MSAIRLTDRISRDAASIWLLAQLLVAMTLAQILVAWIPLRHYARWLRRARVAPAAPPPLVRSIRRKVRIAARWLPWHPQCLPQALAARVVLDLRGYGSVLSLGVADEGRQLSAHAWLKSGELFVCGRQEYAKYGEVARF
ncbi:MAG: lasso peptide biosynthesis B2 protein [Sphingomonadales bacterium]|nr:lasso peptide biosynthesis B2 protein [Sphingomonadales bacterium]MBD3772412.1 lasso peptide biosynthesis B2 protein [Paracoccaceae bacterium]